MTNNKPDLHAIIVSLAEKIDGLAKQSSDPSISAAIATLRRDVDRLIEAESVAKTKAKMRLRIVIAAASAAAAALGGTSDAWAPLIRAVLAALGV